MVRASPSTSSTAGVGNATGAGSTCRRPQDLHEKGVFDDAHGFLQTIAAEQEAMKRQSLENEKLRTAEIAELKDFLARQAKERTDTLNKLRYEIEEFVHKKLDKVIEDVGVMKMTERQVDSVQQSQLDHISKDVDRLKANLFFVKSA